MSTPAIAAILLLLGFVLLFLDWRIGVLMMIIGIVLIPWTAYRRKRAKLQKLKELRNDLQEQNWLEKTRWFSRRGIT